MRPPLQCGRHLPGDAGQRGLDLRSDRSGRALRMHRSGHRPSPRAADGLPAPLDRQALPADRYHAGRVPHLGWHPLHRLPADPARSGSPAHRRHGQLRRRDHDAADHGGGCPRGGVRGIASRRELRKHAPARLPAAGARSPVADCPAAVPHHRGRDVRGRGVPSCFAQHPEAVLSGGGLSRAVGSGSGGWRPQSVCAQA